MRYIIFFLLLCMFGIDAHSRSNNIHLEDPFLTFMDSLEHEREIIRNNESIRALVHTSDCILYAEIENEALTTFLRDSISAMFNRNHGNPDTDRIYLYLSPFHEGREDVWLNLTLEHHRHDKVKDIGGNIKRYATIIDGVRFILFCEADFDFIKPIPGKEVCYVRIREDLSPKEKKYADAFNFCGVSDSFFEWTIALNENGIRTLSQSFFDSWSDKPGVWRCEFF